jgi:hypothetical protein
LNAKIQKQCDVKNINQHFMEHLSIQKPIPKGHFENIPHYWGEPNGCMKHGLYRKKITLPKKPMIKCIRGKFSVGDTCKHIIQQYI